MQIDLESLTEPELRDLHARITERLRLFQQLRAHGQMMEFSLGDRVEFSGDGRRVTGVITRYNRKTVTVLADGGGRWNVSPGLLSREREGENFGRDQRGGSGQGSPPAVVVPPLRLTGSDSAPDRRGR